MNSPSSPGQLFRLASDKFEVYDSIHKGKVITRRCDNLPFMRWPNGHWCIEAAIHLNKLDEKGLSRKGKGGTLGLYSQYISSLLKFILANNLSLATLSDTDFTKYITDLLGETKVINGTLQKKKNRSTVGKMGRHVLDFLETVADYTNDKWMLGENGRIRAWKVRTVSKSSRTEYKWFHRSIPADDAENKRLPIDESDLQLLRQFAGQTKNTFIRMRRTVLLALLDDTGMRRMEASILTVGEVIKAVSQLKNGYTGALLKIPESRREFIEALGPYSIEFRTVKHRGDTSRIAPVNAILLQLLEGYLSARARRLRKIGISDKPDSPFLISFKTGKALRPNTITQELAALASDAAIPRSCSPHLIRHLYIVRLFVRFMHAHEIETKDQFKKALLNEAKFKEQVRELTGHSSIESMEVYLTLATNQIADIKRTLSRVRFQKEVESLAACRDRVMNEVKLGLSPSKAIVELSRAIEYAKLSLGE